MFFGQNVHIHAGNVNIVLVETWSRTDRRLPVVSRETSLLGRLMYIFYVQYDKGVLAPNESERRSNFITSREMNTC